VTGALAFALDLLKARKPSIYNARTQILGGDGMHRKKNAIWLLAALFSLFAVFTALNAAPLAGNETTTSVAKGHVTEHVKAPTADKPTSKAQQKRDVAEPKPSTDTKANDAPAANAPQEDAVVADMPSETEATPEQVFEVEQVTPERFDLPEGVEVEPQSTIVELAAGADLDQMAADLEDSLGPVTIQYVSDTIARVTYASDATVEDAVNHIIDSGYAEAAQPNYVYHVLSDKMGPMGEQLDEASTKADADADEPLIDIEYPQEQLESPVSSDDIELLDKDDDIIIDLTDDAIEDASIEGQAEDDSIVVLPDEEPQITLEAQKSVNDHYAYNQWALNSIGAYDAWNYAQCNHTITVAVLDLGFQTNHPDLAANIVDPYNAYNAVRGGSTSNVSPYDLSFDHGSHVAGIISAVANNGVGIAGITHNAYVMPIKVVSAEGSATTADIVKGYDYVLSKRAARNVRVINLSMGVDARKLRGTDMSLSADDAVIKKIKQAYSAGVVTVIAAGNKGASTDSNVPYDCYPADDDSAVSVINLMQNGAGVTISPYSNYNATTSKVKDISAPGTNIYSTTYSSDYTTLSGTSMAAPVVSSVLALEFVANPKLTPDEAVQILYATATNLGGSSWTKQYGWGEVNAAAAVKAAKSGLSAAQQTKAKLAASYLPGGTTGSSSSTTPTTTKTPNVRYRTHVQNIGWQAWKKNGANAGTTGKSLRLEGIQIKLTNKPYSGSIQYRTHVQTYGWESSWKSNGTTSGTSGQSNRLEAIKIRLTGNMANHYDVYYRVHAQHFGWMGWAKNGASAGTAGYSYRLEAIQIRLVPKGNAAPGSTKNAFRSK